MKRKFIAFVTVMALAVSTLLFGGCDMLSSYLPDEKEITTTTASLVTLSINPKVEFTVSEDNKIEYVNPMNEDAEIILSDIDLTGMSVDEASKLFVELATDSGYIDAESEDNEVTVDIITEDDEEEIEGSIKDKINNYLNNEGISCKISRETFEEYQTEADALGINVRKLKLIYKAIELNPELVKEDLVALDMNALLQLVKGHMKQYSFGVLKDEFFAAKTVIRENYAEMFTLKTEIEALKNQLENFTGTDEEKTALENSKNEKEERFEQLKNAYENEVEALKDEFEAQYDEMKETFKQAKNAVKARVEKYSDDEKTSIKALYNEAKELIKTNFADMFTLEDEIDALEKQIEELAENDETLSDLQTTLSEKTIAYDTLKTAYNLAIETLDAEYEVKFAEIQETFRQEKETIKNQWKQQIEAQRQSKGNEDSGSQGGKN
jgi:chromosome segregation ATPase